MTESNDLVIDTMTNHPMDDEDMTSQETIVLETVMERVKPGQEWTTSYGPEDLAEVVSRLEVASPETIVHDQGSDAAAHGAEVRGAEARRVLGDDEENDMSVRLGLMISARVDDLLAAAIARSAALLIQRDAKKRSDEEWEVARDCLMTERDAARTALDEVRSSLESEKDKVNQMRFALHHETPRNDVNWARHLLGADANESIVEVAKRVSGEIAVIDEIVCGLDAHVRGLVGACDEELGETEEVRKKSGAFPGESLGRAVRRAISEAERAAIDIAAERSIVANAELAEARMVVGAAYGENLSDAVKRRTFRFEQVISELGEARLVLGVKEGDTITLAVRHLRDANVAQDAHVRSLVDARDGETTATAVRRALGAYRKSAVDGDLAGPTT